MPKLRVLSPYQGWASDEGGYERYWAKDEVVKVTDEIAKYLLAVHPDWFAEVKPKAEPKPRSKAKSKREA